MQLFCYIDASPVGGCSFYLSPVCVEPAPACSFDEAVGEDIQV